MITPNTKRMIEAPFQIMEELMKNTKITNPTDLHLQLSKHYEEHFGSDEIFKIIPSLNSMSTPNTVVRYRGIIQDVNNTELVTANYLYREAGFDDNNFFNDSIMIERELYYCIPIPGEAKWSRNSFFSNNEEIDTLTILEKSTQNTKRKRNDEDLECCDSEDMSDEVEFDTKKKRHHEIISTSNKKSISDRDDMLDFPIKGENGLACLIKLYGEDYGFKNTELVDFIGILTYESPNQMCTDEEEFCNFKPEATLVPRLHVLFFKKYKSVFDIVMINNSDYALDTVRNQLLEYLTLAFGGDALVAEVMLYNLISRVRSHNYGVILGKFILNIYNCDKDVAKKLNDILSLLLPSSHLFEMTSTNLEHSRLAPVKDYQMDKLKSGLLQLPSGTHLIIDENSLVEGNLFEEALKNISHLSTLISTQKVDYDYSYHPLTMNVDIPVLIISKGKSLFQDRDVNCMVKLISQKDVEIPIISDSQKLLFRSYISQIARNNHKDIKLTPEVNQLVSQTFVRNRVSDMNISERDLHNWLTISELVHLSFGNFDKELERSSWEHAMGIVNKIKQRI